jgi:hypothetical protein
MRTGVRLANTAAAMNLLTYSSCQTVMLKYVCLFHHIYKATADFSFVFFYVFLKKFEIGEKVKAASQQFRAILKNL